MHPMMGSKFSKGGYNNPNLSGGLQGGKSSHGFVHPLAPNSHMIHLMNHM